MSRRLVSRVHTLTPCTSLSILSRSHIPRSSVILAQFSSRASWSSSSRRRFYSTGILAKHHGHRKVQNPDDWHILGSEGASAHTLRLSHPETPEDLVINTQWLRDACQCDVCVDPHSGQKNFGTCDVPPVIIDSSSKTRDGALEVVWSSDFMSPTAGPHTSRYPANVVQGWFAGETRSPVNLPEMVLWDKKIFQGVQSTFQYDDWMSGGRQFHVALAQLYKYGLIFLEGVPKTEETVVTIANQIGNIQETLYGRTWDVRSKPKAENVAL